MTSIRSPQQLGDALRAARKQLGLTQPQLALAAGVGVRFIVDLDAGATLIAVQQNSHATSSEVNAMRGQRVTLMWNTEHEIPVGT